MTGADSLLRRVARHAPVFVVALALAAAACQTPPPQGGWPEITFGHRPVLRFDVAEVVVEQAYNAPLEAPHVAHDFPVPPATAAERWARDRLAAAGRSGRLIYEVREASAVETPLEIRSGFEGLINIEQSERYDARLVVQVRIEDDGGLARASVDVTAERSITVPEDATLQEREEAWFRLTESLLRDFDAEMERRLRQIMAAHILE